MTEIADCEAAGRVGCGAASPAPPVDESHIRLLIDCAEICLTSADFMVRGSDLHPHTCDACAAVCDRCADECDKHGEDPHMAACAEICRRCAESCREMAGAIH